MGVDTRKLSWYDSINKNNIVALVSPTSSLSNQKEVLVFGACRGVTGQVYEQGLEYPDKKDGCDAQNKRNYFLWKKGV